MVPESQNKNNRVRERSLAAPLRFYEKRSRFYTGLLLFVVVIGLPIVSVPHLRNRLSQRIILFKAAVAGNVMPVVAEAGANPEPFPSEYERPELPAHQAFKLPPSQVLIPQSPPIYIPSPEGSSMSDAAIGPDREVPPPTAESGELSAADESMSDEAEEQGPEYRQGEIEEEAYDLLLESNSKIAEMVKGGDRSMIFDSWGALHRGSDIYWVRVKFRLEDKSIREYIWEVRLDSKEIMPLSYYARTI